MKHPIVEFQEVSKHFGKSVAVDNVSFSVEQGSIFGLLGPNGAGKTTSIRMLTYILIPDSGSIRVDGHNADTHTQQLIGYLPEERGLYKKMKVGEQLLYLCRLRGMTALQARKNIRYWLERFNAQEWISRDVGELSKGMQQKIQFIATIAHDPRILVFDEPFSGLDPINSELLKEVILELRDAGKTIFFATHRMEHVEQLCDHIALFNRGRLVLDGSVASIRSSYGKTSVRLRFNGSNAFLTRLQGVDVVSRSTHFAEIRLHEGTDEQELLRQAMQHVRIQSFEITEPGIQDIYVQTVTNSSAQAV